MPILDADLNRDLSFAISAASCTGERLVALRATGRWQGSTLAEIGDHAADGLLQGLIRGRYPDDGIISEETPFSSLDLNTNRRWIVDPLDGTREYCELREDWAVHVALVVDGRCALGVIALPVPKIVLWGIAIPRHQRGGIDGGGILVDGNSMSPDAPRVMVSRSHTPSWIGRFCESIGAGSTTSCGSAGFKVARVLLGDADIYVHDKGLSDWDTCAPETIARALGWTVSTLDGNELQYTEPGANKHEFVLCRPAWRERVMGALARSGALSSCRLP